MLDQDDEMGEASNKASSLKRKRVSRVQQWWFDKKLHTYAFQALQGSLPTACLTLSRAVGSIPAGTRITERFIDVMSEADAEEVREFIQARVRDGVPVDQPGPLAELGLPAVQAPGSFSDYPAAHEHMTATQGCGAVDPVVEAAAPGGQAYDICIELKLEGNLEYCETHAEQAALNLVDIAAGKAGEDLTPAVTHYSKVPPNLVQMPSHSQLESLLGPLVGPSVRVAAGAAFSLRRSDKHPRFLALDVHVHMAPASSPLLSFGGTG